MQLTPALSSCFLGKCSLLVRNRIPRPPCAGPSQLPRQSGGGGPADSLNEPEGACHMGSGRRCWGGEPREGAGSAALIPVFPCTAFPGRLLASQSCLTTAASGSATPLLNPSDLQLLAYFPVGSSWHQAGIFNPDSATSAWITPGK